MFICSLKTSTSLSKHDNPSFFLSHPLLIPLKNIAYICYTLISLPWGISHSGNFSVQVTWTKNLLLAPVKYAPLTSEILQICITAKTQTGSKLFEYLPFELWIPSIFMLNVRIISQDTAWRAIPKQGKDVKRKHCFWKNSSHLDCMSSWPVEYCPQERNNSIFAY